APLEIGPRSQQSSSQSHARTAVPSPTAGSRRVGPFPPSSHSGPPIMADPTSMTTPSGVTATAPKGDGKPGSPEGFEPYVPDERVMPEFTWQAVIVGTLLGIVFGASSLYLLLKVGMTVSASVPIAVLSITLFRVFSRVFKVRQAT